MNTHNMHISYMGISPIFLNNNQKELKTSKSSKKKLRLSAGTSSTRSIGIHPILIETIGIK